MRYVYGPVPSRRLGWSLGVDVVPAKACSFNCIYCQLGASHYQTVERGECVALEAVKAEIQKKITCQPDYITISGSGEPTLYARLGELVDWIRTATEVPVAILTNGSLLWRKDVQDELSAASLVIPSLDAGNGAMLARVNRPHRDLTFERVVDGMADFRSRFRGEIWLEIMMVAGFTDDPQEVADLAKAAAQIRPDRVQLNTVTRPPAESYALPVPDDDLHRFAEMFTPAAEIIGDAPHSHGRTRCGSLPEDVMNLLRRRPCTLEDVADGLGIHILEAVKHLEILNADQQVLTVSDGTRVFYLAKEQRTQP